MTTAAQFYSLTETAGVPNVSVFKPPSAQAWKQVRITNLTPYPMTLQGCGDIDPDFSNWVLPQGVRDSYAYSTAVSSTISASFQTVTGVAFSPTYSVVVEWGSEPDTFGPNDTPVLVNSNLGTTTVNVATTQFLAVDSATVTTADQYTLDLLSLTFPGATTLSNYNTVLIPMYNPEIGDVTVQYYGVDDAGNLYWVETVTIVPEGRYTGEFPLAGIVELVVKVLSSLGEITIAVALAQEAIDKQNMTAWDGSNFVPVAATTPGALVTTT